MINVEPRYRQRWTREGYDQMPLYLAANQANCIVFHLFLDKVHNSVRVLFITGRYMLNKVLDDCYRYGVKHGHVLEAIAVITGNAMLTIMTFTKSFRQSLCS